MQKEFELTQLSHQNGIALLISRDVANTVITKITFTTEIDTLLTILAFGYHAIKARRWAKVQIFV